MEDTLKQLQEYQLDALRKGIGFNLNVYQLGEQKTEVAVSLSYCDVDTTLTDTRTFSTTFSNSVEDKTEKMRLGRIKKFINDVEDKQ